MYYVLKNGTLLAVLRTFDEAVRYARSAGGYVEHDGRIVWGMQ